MARKSKELLQVQLAKQIVQFARESNLSSGHRLTERSLAETFGVSRSPIRDALKLLIDKGWVRVSPAEGYQLAVSSKQLAERKFDVPDTAAEKLYVQLLRDRFAGHIPRQCGESELKRRYEVSQGLLMTVLLRLLEEGLIRRSQGQGWLFTEVVNTLESFQASYEFRLVLEPSALLAERFVVDPARLDHLYAQQRKLLSEHANSVAKHFELNREFHETLVGFSQNPFFVQSLRQHNQLRRVVEYESYHEGVRIAESSREHLAILDALKAGDREFAASLLRRHLRLAADSRGAFRPEKPANEARPRARSRAR